MGVKSGDIITPITFKSPTVTVNDEGGRDHSYSAAINTKAKVQGVRQSRGDDPATISSEKKFTIRYRAEADIITKDWLITYNGKDYTIHSIEPIDEKQRYLTFTGRANG